ncbi:hypothetical protein [Denitromonas halophila]|uniref:Uncharacterized protein n=1 Tax=Denitromonas halophila TaxID=1629404 RepID=A0A557R0D7_9RHOO|nr:hypothetical protein [Denitromonas halophila]TVO58586.1 hypothetical protein FHP91_02665 [Denitromonas halophila]
MMTERTLSRLILAAVVIFVLSLSVSRTAMFASHASSVNLSWVIAITFALAPLLLMLKIISRLFLSGVKGQPLPLVEQMFIVCYLFLTMEARKEWRDYIRAREKAEGAEQASSGQGAQEQ